VNVVRMKWSSKGLAHVLHTSGPAASAALNVSDVTP